MHSSDIYSKEWCDMVFEGRNKAYGAYKLREQTGARYRRVLIIVLGTLGALLGAQGSLALYAHIMAMRGMKEAEDAFAKKPAELKEGYKVKFLATARQAPTVRTAPGAKSARPKIVDGLPPLETIGQDGPIDYDPEQQVITTPIVDTTGIHDKSLPIAKEKIVPTEQVSQMPEFPGGLRAFMRWLDQHIVYPQECIDRNEKGSVTICFIVDEKGYTTDLEVKNAFDAKIYKAAMDALKRMPKWKPGTDDKGDPTPVKITIPMDFK